MNTFLHGNVPFSFIHIKEEKSKKRKKYVDIETLKKVK